MSDPKQGVSVANKFVGEGVKFVIGHFNSGVTIPASEVYQENGIYMITPAATNPKVTERNMWNVFRTCGRDDQQGEVAGKYIADKYKGKKIAVVHDKTTYGQGLADETRKAMAKGGMKEVLYEGINLGEKDLSALVSKIKAAGADLVYWGGLHTEGGLLVRQLRDQGVKAPVMGGDGIASDEFAAIGGPGVEGTLMTFGPDPRKNPAAAEVVKAFSAKNINPEAYTLYAYAAMQVIAAAAADAKSARYQEGRRSHQVGQGVQDGDRRFGLRQERRHHASRLRDVHLEEGRRRKDHLRPAVRRELLPLAKNGGSPRAASFAFQRASRAGQVFPAQRLRANNRLTGHGMCLDCKENFLRRKRGGWNRLAGSRDAEFAG